MEKTEIYLFGASGHGKVIKDILQANGVNVKFFIDDNPNINNCGNYTVVHNAINLSPIIVSIGANNIRKMIVERLNKLSKDYNYNLLFETAIHPSAIISPSVKIGEGTVIMPGVIINADAIIGKHCIINTGATIDHECIIEDYCHIAPGVNICGCTKIGEGSWIGVGSSIIQCINIGSNTMIGAGSVVVKDIPDNVVAYGNPCKVKRKF